jgi:hypothetical protein
MSVTIELDLPDALVAEARAKGLFQSGQMSDLVAEELRRRKAGDELGKILEKIRAQPGEPMSAEEIQAEIDAVRAERRARRETGR